jgi:hypothetical protein
MKPPMLLKNFFGFNSDRPFTRGTHGLLYGVLRFHPFSTTLFRLFKALY